MRKRATRLLAAKSPDEEVSYMREAICRTPCRHGRGWNMRRLFVSSLVLALSILCVPGQAATVRHSLDRDREAFALWEDPDTGTIAIAHIIPDRNSQSLGLFREYRDADGTVIGTKALAVEQLPIGPYGMFTMNRRLSSATLDVTGVPASCFTSGRAPACTTSTIDAHITWTGVGKRRHEVPAPMHCVVEFDGFLFIENIVSNWSERRAVAGGRMNTTRLSNEDLEDAHLASGVTGQVAVDGHTGHTRNRVQGDCANP
jgi:hypothetical protein